MASRVTVDDNGFIVSVEPASRESLGPAVQNRSYTRTNGEKAPTARNLKQRKKNLKSRSAVSKSKDKALVPCTFCNSRVRADRLPDHVARIHPGKKLPPPTKQRTKFSVGPQPRRLPPKDLSPMQKLGDKSFVCCSICEQNIRSDNWEKHLKKVHANSATSRASHTPPKSKNITQKTLPRSRKGGGASFDPDIRRKALQELHEETAFGDKYLGQFRREADGRFGSLPLYDDYSEDSGA